MNEYKEYTVTLEATAQKEVTVRAATDLEALELIEHLLANTDILDFVPEDVAEIDIRCAGNTKNRRWCRNEDCELHCTTCGACLANEEEYAGCADCKFQCPECGGCILEDDEEED